MPDWRGPHWRGGSSSVRSSGAHERAGHGDDTPELPQETAGQGPEDNHPRPGMSSVGYCALNLQQAWLRAGYNIVSDILVAIGQQTSLAAWKCHKIDMLKELFKYNTIFHIVNKEKLAIWSGFADLANIFQKLISTGHLLNFPLRTLEDDSSTVRLDLGLRFNEASAKAGGNSERRAANDNTF